MNTQQPAGLKDLAEKYRAGDQSAGDHLVDELRSRFLVRFSCIGIKPNDAEDLAQCCLTDVITSLDRFDCSQASIETWASGIARNRVRNHYRRTAFRHLHEVSVEGVDMAVDPEGANVETVEALQTAVNNLAVIDQELLQMRFTLGLSFTEIAEATNLTEANARKRVSRAVDQLRRQPEILSLVS